MNKGAKMQYLILITLSFFTLHAEIATAKQKGSNVYVYDEKGRVLFTKNGELVGTTSKTVSIKKGKSGIYVYDEKGRVLFTK